MITYNEKFIFLWFISVFWWSLRRKTTVLFGCARVWLCENLQGPVMYRFTEFSCDFLTLTLVLAIRNIYFEKVNGQQSKVILVKIQKPNKDVKIFWYADDTALITNRKYVFQMLQYTYDEKANKWKMVQVGGKTNLITTSKEPLTLVRDQRNRKNSKR